MKRYLVVITILALVAVLVAGCAGSPSPITTPTPSPSPAPSPAPAPSPVPAPSPTPSPAPTPTLPAGIGMLEVRVTDAPPEYGTIKEILVTVVDSEEAIMVHKAVAEQEQLGEGDQNQVQNQVQQGEGEWINIPIIGENPFELLELKDKGVDLLLGWAEVPAGKYTQIRMTIEEVTVIFEGATEAPEDDETKVAELPSGKLKFVRPFNVVDGETTIILLDFIADKSVTITGKGDVIFKPVIKLEVSGKGKPNKLGYSLETTGDATAELSTDEAYSGEESIHLLTSGDVGDGDEARIVIPLPDGTTLGDIDSISWWEYNVEVDELAGYPPHLDMFLDVDKNGTYDGYPDDDVLVFEYAYNDHYAEGGPTYGALTDDWYQTFSDDGNGPAQVDGTASAWPGSGPPGPPESIELYTLADWQSVSGITYDTKTVDSTTPVLWLEIEVDNWVLQTEAYVDDIEIVIDGDTYTIDF